MKNREAIYQYKMAMALVRHLCGQGVITLSDKAKVEKKIAIRYSLKKISLYRETP